jgi:hypothetical protein
MTEPVAEERAIVLPDWPQPAVVASPRICADDSSLLIRFRTADDKIVVVRFPLCNYVIFGAPNDEVLGHRTFWKKDMIVPPAALLHPIPVKAEGLAVGPEPRTAAAGPG